MTIHAMPDYPLPPNLHQSTERNLAALPDRGGLVFRLRRFIGEVYAQGYEAGRRAGYDEAHADVRQGYGHTCEPPAATEGETLDDRHA